MASAPKAKKVRTPEVWISKQLRSEVSLRGLMRRIKGILGKMKLEGISVSVVLMSDRQIAQLHERYLGLLSPTDVMAFPGRPPFLGEVVVSLETARRRAPEFNHSWRHELILYVCHGLLHLTGYRDDTAAGKKRMEKRQEQLLGWRSKKPKLSF